MNPKTILALLAAALLAWSFWRDGGWLQLCAGLAMFLFGMQCLEEGLRQLAGGRLERLLASSTATPAKGLMFGIFGTMLLQSSTLVSLLTIAFVSTGLIQLAGGITIVFGANLGATSGIWLLALAGQDFSLSPLALPLLVFGVLAGFSGPKGKAAGRVVLGIAFIFLGIDQIKDGFSAFGGALDTSHAAGDVAGTLLFVAAGLVVTVILQSSHATLMLTLAALAAGQLELGHSLAIAIGSKVGSSVSTAFVGFLGGNRSGQRLALAHVLFNVVTAILALILLVPLTWLVQAVAGLAGLGANLLLQLALFHTLFNASGVALFWSWQARLAQWLERWLPDRAEPPVLLAVSADPGTQPVERVRARYLSEPALDSADAAAAAVTMELRHLGRLSVEVICHALYVPVDELTRPQLDEAALSARPDGRGLDAEALYQRHVKGVYGDLLSFMGRLEVPLDESHQRFWSQCQMAALQLVNAVKDAKHLQKNLGARLAEADSPQRDAYVSLRRHLMTLLRALHEPGESAPDGSRWQARLEELDRRAAEFDAAFRHRLFAMVRSRELDGLQIGSLMKDLGYVGRIYQSLRDVMLVSGEQVPVRDARGSVA